MSNDTDAYLAFAHRLADLSGETILPWFRRQHEIVNKDNRGAFDPVTQGDRAGEEVMRKEIEAAWPDHGIVGEEFGVVNENADLRWILDPIDGTRGFIIGLPVWGTLIGLAAGDEPRLGIMNQPFTGDRYWSGSDATYHRWSGKEQIIHTRACPNLDQAILAASSPGMFATGYEKDRFDDLTRQVRMRRFGTDCYAYCLLAAGHIDIVCEAAMNIYDIAALVPIIENAGGRVTTWDGGNPLNGSRIVAVGDPRLHEQVLKVLNS